MAKHAVPPQAEEPYEADEGTPRGALSWFMSMPYWAVSAVLHTVLALLLGTIVWKTAAPEEREVVIQLGLPSLPAVVKPPPYDASLPRAMERMPDLGGDETDRALIEHKESEITPDIPKGTSMENITDVAIVDLNPDGTNDPIGTGGGAAAARGTPDGTCRARGSRTMPSESAVRAALEWLRRHQSADGSWKSRDFTENCTTACACQDGRYGDGRGLGGHDVGVTGLAVLAFTGIGATHLRGEFPEYVDCLRKAVTYLKQVQVHSTDPASNGRFGPADGEQWIYDHAIATMAMTELLIMSRDVIGLKKTVTDAVELCLTAQNPGAGWRYGIRPGTNDTSVTGWMVLALKTARHAQLDIPKERFSEAFKGALTWLGRATATSGKTGYASPGDAGSHLQGTFPDPYPYSKQLSCMTAVGVLCRTFAGEKRGSPTIKDGVALLMTEIPQWVEQRGTRLSRINFYYWYYASYAMFQIGGADWRKWSEAMLDALVRNQRQGVGLCEDGSWDPLDEWGPAGGRVYATAICAMTLEVYCRYEREESAAGRK